MQDASGVQTFTYGNMGELTQNIHTFVVPNGAAYTFETDWEYDSWNRVKKIVYPDGEEVSYDYDNGGNLYSMSGTKGNSVYGFISSVLYNEYGARAEMTYANGTHTEYTYDPLNQRLANLTSYEMTGLKMQDIDYTYDAAGNITYIDGSGNYVGVTNKLGGAYNYEYGYDDLYRLTSGAGIFISHDNGILGFSEDLEYSPSGNITSKEVSASKLIGGGVVNVSYNNTYTYGNQPHAVSSAGINDYMWDANGNMTQRDNGSQIRRMCWDEENRLTTVHDNEEFPVLSSYLYNAGGERVWKLSGVEMLMRLDGKKLQLALEYGKTLYASPLMVMTETEYTKHYYIEGERVCSKIGGGFGPALTSPLSTPITFIQGTASEVSDDLWAMVLRGVDCSGYLTTRMRIKTTLPPAASTANNNETNQYFYHSDHLGSSSFVSDAIGYATQHLQYLPYGELFVDQHGAFDSRYKFSAKELDDETQYSYFGARYYDSDLSIWLSVDPMADVAPNESPYSYAGNNPVYYKDIDGFFKFPTKEEYKAAKISPAQAARFEKVVSNMQSLIQNSPEAMNALINGTGLTEEQILYDLTPNQGPQIHVAAGSNTNAMDGQITIGAKVIEYLAGIDENDKEQLGKQAFGVALLILDEYTHYGDKQNNEGNSTGGYYYESASKSYIFDFMLWGKGYIRNGSQNWGVSPTGHRGGDTQLFGFGYTINPQNNGFINFHLPKETNIYFKLPGTERIPTDIDPVAIGIDLLTL